MRNLNHSMEPVDIAIAGSGAACTALVIAVLKKLLADAPARQLRFAVIEKHPEFWLGIPYGSRSSVNALTITSVSDFFTSDAERNQFFDWFNPRKDDLLAQYAIKGGLGAELWLKNNRAAVAN